MVAPIVNKVRMRSLRAPCFQNCLGRVFAKVNQVSFGELAEVIESTITRNY